MARASAMVKPQTRELLQLEVLASEPISPHYRRVTVGGRDIERFVAMGYDQWFRLFLPTGDPAALDRIPPRANEMLGYLRYLAMSDRPLMRNYTVSDYRPGADGPQIDIDFVVHGPTDDPTASAVAWATHCGPGDRVAIIDEGIGFNPARGVTDVLLVADETGVPAVRGILASLPDSATGVAWCEVPGPDDRLELPRPAGVELRYVVRPPSAVAGESVLAAAREAHVPAHAFIVGEQSMVAALRRDLVGRGASPDQVSFCSYWKLPKQRR